MERLIRTENRYVPLDYLESIGERAKCRYMHALKLKGSLLHGTTAAKLTTMSDCIYWSPRASH